MLRKKKTKIADYLIEKSSREQLTVFDSLLEDHLNGKLKNRLSEFNISKIQIHIDWFSDYKCIDIQGKYQDYYIDIQIEQEIFSFAVDKDEPDDFTSCPLIGHEAFYQKISDMIASVN